MTHDTVSHSLQALRNVEGGLICPYLGYQHHRIIPSEVPRYPNPCDGAQYDGNPRGAKDSPIDADQYSVHIAVPIHRRWAALEIHEIHERESNGRQCCGGLKEGNASDTRVVLIEDVTVRWQVREGYVEELLVGVTTCRGIIARGRSPSLLYEWGSEEVRAGSGSVVHSRGRMDGVGTMGDDGG